MHFEGQQSINAPIETVWAFLLDPNRVGPCAPGYQRVEVISDERFRALVSVGLGPVKATFNLDATLADLRPPQHAVVRARGVAGGSAVDMASTMDLEAEGESATRMSWSADVTVSGTIASVGARLMNSTAEGMTAKFFGCIRQQLEASSS